MARVTFQRRHFQALLERAEIPDGVPEREQIRDMLLALDDDIPPAPFPLTGVLGLALNRHWRAQNRTALWFPHPYNRYRVAEIYLRYGKSEEEIRAFHDVLPPAENEPPDLGGFPAHVHMAIGLCGDGFFYQLAFGRHAWLDLNHMSELLRGPSSELFAAIANLSANGYLLWWVPLEMQEIGYFGGPVALADYISNPPLPVDRSRDWFVIRKDISLQADGNLDLSTEEIVTEIRRLFPAFNFIAERRPPL